MATWKPGDRVFVQYAAGDIFHEMLLLHAVGPRFWVICTPDFDVYGEDVAVGQDAHAVRYQGRRAGLPAGISEAYRFSRLTAAQLADLQQEGRDYAYSEGLVDAIEYGEDAGGGGGGAKIGAASSTEPPPGRAGGRGGAGAARLRHTEREGGQRRRMLEGFGEAKVGDLISSPLWLRFVAHAPSTRAPAGRSLSASLPASKPWRPSWCAMGSPTSRRTSHRTRRSCRCTSAQAMASGSALACRL